MLALFAGEASAQSLPGSVSAGNSSTIDQIGSNNSIGSGSGAAIVYGVDQQVSGNTSGNWSGIYQGTNVSSASNDSATVHQVAAGGAKNAALTIQGGAHNTAQTWQNTAVTYATPPGTFTFTAPSISFTTSSGGTLTYPGFTASPQAYGTFVSTIDQSGSSNSTAKVYQGGWNLVTQQPNLSAPATGADYSSVIQTGSQASMQVRQINGASNYSSATQGSSTAILTQDGYAGYSNVSVLNQSAGAISNNMSQDAVGGNNISYINQTGGTVNQLTQVSWGGTNTSGIYQIGGTVDVEQYAYATGNNSSTIWMSGGGSVSVSQTTNAEFANTSIVT